MDSVQNLLIRRHLQQVDRSSAVTSMKFEPQGRNGRSPVFAPGRSLVPDRGLARRAESPGL